MAWHDLFKLWKYATHDNPVSRREKLRNLDGAGVTQPDVMPDIRGDGNFTGGGRGSVIRLRDSTDFIDLSSVTNRQSRYKEYERLRTVAEIETAMTVFADESCVAGHTPVMTPMGGIPIAKLAQIKKPDEMFLVYCYDFEKEDFTLGWAHHPRKTKTAYTLNILLDDGTTLTCTPDHRVLRRDGSWCAANDIKPGDDLMPFFRVKAGLLHKLHNEKQHPRVFTFKTGWKSERQLLDEFRTGKKTQAGDRIDTIMRCIAQGLNTKQIASYMKKAWGTLDEYLGKDGLSYKEIKRLHDKFPDRKKVVSIDPGPEIDVYDLTVKTHANFCTDSAVVHNCQVGDNNHVMDIRVKNTDIKEELEFLFFHPKMLNVDRKLYNWAKNLYIFGDYFLELVIDPEEPKQGVLKVQPLPADSVYRIETIKGKVLEFQQSKTGPDYESLARVEVTQATDLDLMQATAIRFSPEQVVHFKIGDERRTYYPYGVSLVDAARGPAHQLRMMEDAMLVYRLCLVGNTRVRTNGGFKHIKEVAAGDRVFSVKGNTPIENSVLRSVCNGTQPVMRLASKHTEIVGTKTHPVLVLDENGERKYVEIQHLQPHSHRLLLVPHLTSVEKTIDRVCGEEVAKLSHAQSEAFRTATYANISELIRKSGVGFDRAKQFLYGQGKSLPTGDAEKLAELFALGKDGLVKHRKGEINPERIKVPATVTPEFARLLGFLFGDGYTRRHEVGFAAGTDHQQNLRYAALMEKFFTVAKWEPDKRSDCGCGKYSVKSSQAALVLANLGFVGKAKTKRVPVWLFNAPTSVREEFVRGLADADACQRRTRRGTWFATFELCNLGLVEDIKELWHGIGKCSGLVRTRERKNGHCIEPCRVMKPTTSHTVTISELALPYSEPVLSVSAAGEQLVYDITVANESHNFVANGIPVHNTRAPERRVFYIDVGQLPPFKADMVMDRLKDQLRKRKTFSSKGGGMGAAGVEERWQAPSQDEDFWIPTRPNSNTRVETLPGAQNLGEIDDALYFRNKLFIALNFPKNYMAQEDAQITRVTLSSVDVKFARQVERLQQCIADGLTEIAVRHLELRGFPPTLYEDLQLRLTPPSHYRDLSNNEVNEIKYQRAMALKGSQLFSDFDILVKILDVPEEEAKQIVARSLAQKLQDLRLQMMAANPQLMGVVATQPQGAEIGTDPMGPNPQMGGTPPPGPAGAPPPGGLPPGLAAMEPSQGMDTPPPPAPGQQGDGTTAAQDTYGQPEVPEGKPFAEPREEDIKRFDLEITDFSQEIDEEEIDTTELDDE